jgi:phosphatidylglycerol:prolipoprotein diacylglycerol transferase
MYPILMQFGPWRIFNHELGPFALHSYGFMLATAFIVGLFFARREAARLGEDPDRVSDLSFWIILTSVIGSRVWHVVVFWHELSPPRLLSAFKIWEGGLVYYGGFVAAVTASIIYCRLTKFDFWQMADIISPSIALGLMFGRTGCTLVGCCYGKPCPPDFFAAITFPPGTIGVAGTPLYPTQPAEALGCLAIFLFLWLYLRRRRTFRGEVLAAFVILYSALRFVLEFWRDDPRGFAALFTFHATPGLTAKTAGGLFGLLLWANTFKEMAHGVYGVSLSESQMTGVIFSAAAVALWVWKSRRDRLLGVAVAAPAPPAPRAAVVKRKAKRK